MTSTTTDVKKQMNEIKLSFNGKPAGWVMAKYISYDFDEDDNPRKILDYIDSAAVITNALPNEPHPAQSANIHEILFTLDSTFLRYESRDKLGETINLQYIPIKHIIDVDVWREDFDVPNAKELSKEMRHSLK